MLIRRRLLPVSFFFAAFVSGAILLFANDRLGGTTQDSVKETISVEAFVKTEPLSTRSHERVLVAIKNRSGFPVTIATSERVERSRTSEFTEPQRGSLSGQADRISVQLVVLATAQEGTEPIYPKMANGFLRQPQLLNDSEEMFVALSVPPDTFAVSQGRKFRVRIYRGNDVIAQSNVLTVDVVN